MALRETFANIFISVEKFSTQIKATAVMIFTTEKFKEWCDGRFKHLIDSSDTAVKKEEATKRDSSAHLNSRIGIFARTLEGLKNLQKVFRNFSLDIPCQILAIFCGIWVGVLTIKDVLGTGLYWAGNFMSKAMNKRSKFFSREVFESAEFSEEKDVSQGSAVCESTNASKDLSLIEEAGVLETAEFSEEKDVSQGSTVCESTSASKETILIEEDGVWESAEFPKEKDVSQGSAVCESTSASKETVLIQEIITTKAGEYSKNNEDYKYEDGEFKDNESKILSFSRSSSARILGNRSKPYKMKDQEQKTAESVYNSVKTSVEAGNLAELTKLWNIYASDGLNADWSLVKRSSSSDKTILIGACSKVKPQEKQGDTGFEIVRFLVETIGFDVNAETLVAQPIEKNKRVSLKKSLSLQSPKPESLSPLSIAIQNKSLHLIAYLLNKGAKASQKNTEDMAKQTTVFLTTPSRVKMTRTLSETVRQAFKTRQHAEEQSKNQTMIKKPSIFVFPSFH